jgi:hypothetical protein
MDIQRYVEELAEKALAGETEMPDVPVSESLEPVLTGRAVELWSKSTGRLFLVVDEEDARLAEERFRAGRGEIYTSAEARCIVTISEPALVAEIHEWKRRFNGQLR